VLRHHWPDVPLFGDVAELDGTQFRGVTMVTGGSPCQDLSIAGKRKGMTEGSGTRSSLFFEQVRIWNESEAPYILWENVYGAFSSNAGRDFAAVLSAIVGGAVPVPSDGWVRAGVVAGPAGVAAWRVLDAQYFGVPQRRRRVFVLGVRGGGVDPAEVLSLAESLSGHLAASGEAREGVAADVREGASVTRTGFSTTGSVGYVHDVMPTLPHKTGLGCAGAQMMGVIEQMTFSTPAIGDIREDSVSSTITKNTGGGGETQNPAFVLALDIYNQSISPNGVAHTIRAMNTGEGVPHTLTYDARGNGDGAVILRNREGKPGGGKGPLLSAERSLTLGTANDQVLFVGVPRRLTPVECERLMGWPDQHTAHGISEAGKSYALADTARYKLCGNGIASPVTAWIGFQLAGLLTDGK
jgi:DNA (cytosine-5)-methyltransferase 1